MTFDTRDFYSDDPLVRHNAHMLAKGRKPFPEPDLLRKVLRENGDPGDEQPEDDAA